MEKISPVFTSEADCEVCKKSIVAIDLDLTAYGWACDDCRIKIKKFEKENGDELNWKICPV